MMVCVCTWRCGDDVTASLDAALNKAGRQNEAINLLEQLAKNAIKENRQVKVWGPHLLLHTRGTCAGPQTSFVFFFLDFMSACTVHVHHNVCVCVCVCV